MLDIFTHAIPKIGRLFSESFEAAEADTLPIFQHFESLLPQEPEILSEVTYEDLIDWFIKQPKHPDLNKGAILRTYHSDNKIAIIQLFLDESNNVIGKFEESSYGRKIVCLSIDDELAETFDRNNLIIVS